MTEWGLDTLFNPGKRHMDEEKRRLQSTREEVGDSSGGRRIDLESGTVVISRKKPKTPDDVADGEIEDSADDEIEDSADDEIEDSADDEIEDSADGETDRNSDGETA
jgi:hypothetical protein